MTREEMLMKLKSIKPTAHPTVMTYDMGMQIDVMNSKGGTTDLGNYGDWPLWKFKRLTPEQITLIKNKSEQGNLSLEDFANTELYLFVKQILNNIKDVDLNKAFNSIDKYPDSNGELFYIFCDTGSWKFELEMFDTEEEISKEFFSRFYIDDKWDECDDDTLKEYIESLEEFGEGLCFYNTKDEEESEE